MPIRREFVFTMPIRLECFFFNVDPSSNDADPSSVLRR